MVTDSFEVAVPVGNTFRTRFATSLQRDFDLSNIAQFLHGGVVSPIVSCDRS
jgi:hypothetical protein